LVLKLQSVQRNDCDLVIESDYLKMTKAV
jgi:hypothetical protein